MESGMGIDRIMAAADEGGLFGKERGDRVEGRKRPHVSQKGRGKREKADLSASRRNDKMAGSFSGSLVTLTRKQRGEMAEAALLAKAAGLGFRVAKPWREFAV